MTVAFPSLLQDIPQFEEFEVRPGIVDFHGDGFERHLAPRRGALKDLTEGFLALDAELAANGITTAMLAQFWSWEGGMRGPDYARRIIATLGACRDRLFTDMYIQLRVETHLIDDFEEIAALVEEAGIRCVIFNDHLPHAALEQGKKPPRLTGQAIKSGRSPEAHWTLLQELHAKHAEVPAALEALSIRLQAGGVLLGSHDDATAEGRAWFRGIGAPVAEFPESWEAIEAAREDVTILGAPNVVRGGSHKKKISALEGIRRGLCDVLVSDYHYPAQRQAALMLEAEGIDGWKMISEAPAKALGFEDRGRLAPGLRADLTVLDTTGRVAGTLVGGRWSHLTQPLLEVL